MWIYVAKKKNMLHILDSLKHLTALSYSFADTIGCQESTTRTALCQHALCFIGAYWIACKSLPLVGGFCQTIALETLYAIWQPVAA